MRKNATRFVVAACAAVTLFALPLVAQDEIMEEEFLRLVEDAIEDGTIDDEEMQDLWATKEELMFGGFVHDDLRDLMRYRRADVQTGSSSSSAGTTTSVINPLLPAAFGLSFENGAVTQSTAGTTATISINPAGLVCATGANAVAVRTRDAGCGGYDFARRFGVSLGFDTSRNQSNTPGIAPIGNQFSNLAVRAELVNQRQPASSAFGSVVRTWELEQEPLLDQIGDLRDLIDELGTPEEDAVAESEDEAEPENTIFVEFQNAIQDALANAQAQGAADTAQQILEAAQGVILPLLDQPGVQQIVSRAVPAYVTAVKSDRELMNQLLHAWVATAEYTLKRPTVATEAIGMTVPAGERPPSLHTARLIVAKGLPDHGLDFTLNVSSSWFEETRPGMSGRLRDVQVAADAKFLLREIPGSGYPVLSLAGLFMHLAQEPLGMDIPAFNGTSINQAGNLGLFQTKIEFPTANAAVRIPFSFTYASRTELIQESDVRGQIGITLNFDSLFAPGP